MALIVETGAGVANADAYSPMVWIDAYHAARGRTAWAAAAESTEREPAVRRGTRAIDVMFADRWPGQRTYGRAQDRAWPRTNVTTTEGDDLDDDEIPIELQEAAAEAAWIELNEEGALISSSTDQLERSVRVGPISVDYWWGGSSAPTARLEAYIPFFEKLLWNLLLESSRTGIQWLLRA